MVDGWMQQLKHRFAQRCTMLAIRTGCRREELCTQIGRICTDQCHIGLKSAKISADEAPALQFTKWAIGEHPRTKLGFIVACDKLLEKRGNDGEYRLKVQVQCAISVE